MKNESIHTIHFIAICGTAMANLAVKMKDIGYHITGSDENYYPPMSTFLEKNKIPVWPQFNEKNLQKNPDLVIIGNAVVRGNPEAEYVLENKLPYMSLPEALKEFFLRGKQNIVITGTHGKTTSSSLMAWILQNAGFDPSFLIGGIPENFGHGFQIGTGKQFILEGDEYDSAFFDKRSKFIHYLPEIVVLNNIEFDHADIFRNLEDIKISFQHLLKLIPRNGLIVANGDDDVINELTQSPFAPIETFGLQNNVNWQIKDICHQQNGVNFSFFNNGDLFGKFFLPLAGHHNIMNAAGVLVVLNHLGVNKEKIQEGFNSFKNVKRRLEVRGEASGVTVYDDFAHHPTAIRETLYGLYKQNPQRRIWAIFEPRTNTTRRNIFQDEIKKSFEKAYGVAIGAINRPHLIPAKERLDRENICDQLKKQNKKCFYHDNVDEIISWLLPQLKKDDRVVIMSNGGFDNIHEKLLKQLKENQSQSESSSIPY